MKANKQKFGAGELKALFAGAQGVTVSRGAQHAALDLKAAPPGSAAFAEAVLGPTGNLRAPTARIGKRWLVGFGEATWADALG